MVNVDPITLEVVRGSLVSTVLQMRATLIRTAYAPIIYETFDFSCGIMTGDGELAAMSEDFSGHVFAMALGLNAARAKFEGRINPGDVLAVNDPYTGGTHLNDIAFYTPFFVDGKILLYIGVRAHHSDVGGATPGSFSGQDTEIYQEGVRIVPVKIIEDGKINQGLWDVLFANMRLQDEREGDALAMLDTARIAEMNLEELCAKYGPGVVEESIRMLMDSAEDTMRERISELPDGEYCYEHYMDNGGLSPEPLPIMVKATIEGDTMTFDFTGTAPQIVGPMNCGIPVTRGGAFVIIKSWLDPKTPVNGGTFRPIEFVIPEGSCLAAQLPAPVGGCWEIYWGIQTAIVGLFAQVTPWEPGAENFNGTHHVYVGGYDQIRGRYYILYEYPMGGNPATIDTDGATGTFGYAGGDLASVYPAETSEQRQPLLMEGLAIRTDSESPGYRRSGFGVDRWVRILADSSQLGVMSDRAIIPPWGAQGAYPGSLNKFTVIRGSEEIQPSVIPGKVKAFPMQAGDVLAIETTSGGGVGDPLEREVERVSKDVLDGYVSVARARDVYGVVFDDGQVDRAKTEAQRRKLREQRTYFKVIEDPVDEFDRNGCRLGPLSPKVARRVGVEEGDMVEYIGKAAAPLRAWVKIDDELPGDAVRVGPVGRKILQSGEADEVWLRALPVNTPVLD